MSPFLLDVSHTSHTRARTGIQRVVRSLRGALAQRSVDVTFDPFLDAWRPLQPWERENLESSTPATKRGAKWPWPAKLRGHAGRLLSGRSKSALPTETAGIIIPELFSAEVATSFRHLFNDSSGPRVALFHDAIALKLPELTPTKTVARYPSYLRELLQFDGIAAVSEDSRTALIEYWRWLEVPQTPVVQTITLGIDPPSNLLGYRIRSGEPQTAAPSDTNRKAPVVLSVGSIEGRKNHLALLLACERLWAKGLPFELRLIGLAQAQTGAAALEKIRALQSAGRALRYEGAVDDATVSHAYATADVSVYPSLMEGFGLPVLESVAHGTPCICSSGGALGEAARGGGCVALEAADAESIANALERILTNPNERSRLAAEARQRSMKSWTHYATELTDWISTLKRCR